MARGVSRRGGGGSVVVKDMGMERFQRELRKAKHMSVVIGIHEGSDNGEGESVAEYAAYNEYGTRRIPERSFMRSTFDEQVNVLQRLMRVQYARVQAGTATTRRALEYVAMQHESDIKSKIRNLRTPPNAEATIRKKKSDNPLIDAGTMINSVRYVIRSK